MGNRDELLSEFFENINRVVKELDSMEGFAYDISTLYNGNKFPEQEKLSGQLENLAIAITHETASQLSFLKNDVEQLSKFIEFREKYSEFTDYELEEILDNNPTSELRKNLLTKFHNAKSMINKINSVKHNWNSTFNNTSYSKLKKKFRI